MQFLNIQLGGERYTFPPDGVSRIVRNVPGAHRNAYAILSAFSFETTDDDAHLQRLVVDCSTSIDRENSSDAVTSIVTDFNFRIQDNPGFFSLGISAIYLQLNALLVIPEDGD